MHIATVQSDYLIKMPPSSSAENTRCPPATLFGTDGLRGRANRGNMTVETALALGRAIGVVFGKERGHNRIVIGKDTRLSCYMIESALIAGLCSMGIDTLMVGPFPTPAVAFITRAYRAVAGIVISASHNPYRDNGIKIFSGEGYKLSDQMQSEISSLIKSNCFDEYLPPDHGIGRNARIHDADGRYIEFAKATFPKSISLKGLRLVLDCANGAAHRIAPMVFRELDAEVHAHSIGPDGLNINDNCGSLHPQVIQKAVIDTKADAGIALDGDGDRIIMVDENAQIVDGDTLLAICAYDMKKRGTLRRDAVVATEASCFGFLKTMKDLGIEVHTVAVGDRHVVKKMREEGCNLGGEPSGHTLLLDYNTTSDGIVTALQVLRIMIQTDSRLSDLAALMSRYPQVHRDVRVLSKPALKSIGGLTALIDQARSALAEEGRVFIRYSGTEDLCRILIEAPQFKLAAHWADQLASQIEAVIGAKTLAM